MRPPSASPVSLALRAAWYSKIFQLPHGFGFITPENGEKDVFVDTLARLGHRHQLLNRLIERIALGDDLIDDAEGSGILGRQEIVAVEGLFDRGVVLAGVADIDLVQAPLQHETREKPAVRIVWFLLSLASRHRSRTPH